MKNEPAAPGIGLLAALRKPDGETLQGLGESAGQKPIPFDERSLEPND